MEIFDAAVRATLERFPSQRLGQASFNTLYDFRSKSWTDEIHGTDRDPFYMDEKLPAFRAWLADKFEDEYKQRERP
jgi:hypothetical protein